MPEPPVLLLLIRPRWIVTAGGSPATFIVPAKLQLLNVNLPLTVPGPLLLATTPYDVQGPVKLPFDATVSVHAITFEVLFR